MAHKRKRLTAFLTAASLISALSSCSSDVGRIYVEAPSAQTSSQPAVTTEAPTTTQTVTTTTETTTTTTTTTTVAVMRGNIYDSNKTLLTRSELSEDGREMRYYNSDYQYSVGNIISAASAGLDTELEDTLRVKNPTPVNDTDTVGQSVELTIDANVQAAIYNYMQNMNIVGSVVVMRTDGSIMSEVSYPSYSPEAYQADPSYADGLPWGAMGNRAFQNATPGSCFKIMSEVIADKHGITTLYDDGTWVDGGATIVNWNHDAGCYPIPNRTLYSAFVDSSNIFFAKVFDQIGTDTALSDLNSLFHFVDTINCDFGSIDNNIEVYCADDLRRSAFGQAYVRTCPIYLAALAREAVFGDMVKPFVVKNIVDTNDPNSTISAGSAPYEVIASIPQEYRQNLLDGMLGVTGHLGVYVPEGYQLYTKTGTAETGAGDYLYITGCLRNNNDQSAGCPTYADYSSYKENGSYIIILQIQNPKDHGFNYASDSGALYKGIIDTVLAN